MSEQSKSGKASFPSTPFQANGPPPPAWHAEFLRMLPKITDFASFAFRHLIGDQREEMIQEVIANALAAYARLVERDRDDAATWSTLARYAVRQVRDGRQVGTNLNIGDVCSRYCQQRKQVHVQSLFHWDDLDQEWREMAVEDRHATPADIAAFRIDFRFFREIGGRLVNCGHADLIRGCVYQYDP